MYCVYCGSKNPDTGLFRIRCGQNIVRANLTAASTAGVPPFSPTVPRVRPPTTHMHVPPQWPAGRGPCASAFEQTVTTPRAPREPGRPSVSVTGRKYAVTCRDRRLVEAFLGGTPWA